MILDAKTSDLNQIHSPGSPIKAKNSSVSNKIAAPKKPLAEKSELTKNSINNTSQSWFHRNLGTKRELPFRLPGQNLEWLQSCRKVAREHFIKYGFPQKGEESWKYTRTNLITKGEYSFPEPLSIKLDVEEIAHLIQVDKSEFRMVFVNGYFTPHLSSLMKVPRELTIKSLAEILDNRPELAEPYLARIVKTDRQGFCAINTTAMNDGAFIHIPANTKLTHPIHLLYLNYSQNKPIICQPRNLFVFDHNSEAMVVENHVSLSENSHFCNSVTEIDLGDGAKLNHQWVQNENPLALHISTLTAKQGADSQFTSNNFALGAALCRSDVDSKLEGEGAKCTINGFYLTDNNRHMDFHTRIDHFKPHCRSQELVKGILAQKSRGVFNGKLVVHPGANGTDASQKNANLLLSKEAEADSKPELEIFADDVKCAHGATVGQLDGDALFYLTSRGIAKKEAEQLLTMGFAQEVIDLIDHQPWQRWVRELIQKRLTHFLGAP
ncbi:MAG: Fe-S cluster assembly protein SufD [Magnetococcales bacterium]|nr:Fe-S cluster assembly protein SufD [Magnetococcales bacterium]